MSNQIDYEAEVKKVYTKAKLVSAEFGYVILSAFNEGLSMQMPTQSDPWQNAYNYLKQKGNI